ncbi:fasciclin domain-containing protein [Chryseobacterium salviniae]|uniref:Fasciclin domain-containing protein n=1 Tax=Chryseobacterium salviniae TaxID=3101750 RepID=A0ABU6HXW0_9FLAO|nr:fasciclin domain-containing protein [Chryseobacterium sp. T9W2-O]MEC3877880.1 fasciclin domain-containing protein [Chryseobacterium sp. T9W2-O]
MKKFSLHSMKNYLKVMFSFLALSLVVISCDDNDDDEMTQMDKNIATLVSERSDLSLLRAAVTRAGLGATLSESGSFTVFAPTNDAFTSAGLGSEAAINAVPVETLKNILLYHVFTQKYAASGIPSGTTELTTASNSKAYVSKKSNGVYINGAMVTTADVNASNGVIHVINKVLMPPAGNIVQVAQGNSNLSFLVAAVVRASEGSTNVASVLSTTNGLTVFAPTNQAFINAGFTSIASIQAANPNTLASILTYHVISARVFSSDLTEGATPATLNGANVTITLSGGAKVKGNGNPSASNITSTDIMATNGVVHVIDRVLLP